MSLALAHSSAPEVFPKLVTANSRRSLDRPAQTGARDQARRTGAFASSLSEFQTRPNGPNSMTRSEETLNKREDRNTSVKRSVEDDNTERHNGEGAASARAARSSHARNSASSARKQTESHIASQTVEENATRRILAASGPSADTHKLVDLERQLATQGGAPQMKGVFPVSMLAGLMSEQLQSLPGETSSGDNTALVKSLIESKEQLSGAYEKNASLMHSGAGGVDERNLTKRSALNATVYQTDSQVRSAVSVSGLDQSELFQRFGIKPGNLLVKENTAGDITKSAASDLQTLTLAPNIRQAILASSQNKREVTNDNDETRGSKESPVEGGFKAGAALKNNPAGLQNWLRPVSQSGFSAFMSDGMVLNGASETQSAQVENVGALMGESVGDSRVLPGQVPEPTSRGAATPQARAGFILPDRFGQTLRAGVKSITIQITPKHLGSAQLQVSLLNNNVSGTLFVESQAAKAAVEVSIEQLAQRLSEEGLSLDRLDVEVAERQQGREDFGAEGRDSERREDADAKYERNITAVDSQKNVRTFERRSIVTALRIDAVA